jgi:arylsulfatase A-like enzyme
LKGAKGTTYEGGFRVPAIIRWPKGIPRGTVTNELVTTMDLFTTLIHLAGAELPDDRVIDGQNVYSVLKGETHSPERTFFYLRGETVQAVRKGNWKLRCTPSTGYELYNLEIDPSEMYNLAEKNQDLVNELYQALVSFSNETKARIESVDQSTGN